MNVNKEILRLAVPNVISNVTVPLLGLIDLAILGRLDSIVYLDAVAIGSLIFNFVYWNFSFLRMGASGITAQAYGAGDVQEQFNILLRGLIIAFLAGLLLIVFQHPVSNLAFYLIEGSPAVTAEAEKYFSIRIYAAPAAVAMFAFSGWFIGMQNSIAPMAIAIAVNICNGIANYTLAIVMGMNAEGVAWGTLISQYFGVFLFVAILVIRYSFSIKTVVIDELLNSEKIKKFFTVNADIFLRTFCVIAVMSFFTSKSAAHSNAILAVNTVLIQYFLTYSFFIDGFAYAAEAIVGRLVGAGDRKHLILYVKQIFKWGGGVSLAVSLVFVIAGDGIMYLLTDNKEIVEESQDYLFWIKIVPIVAMLAFLWDGVYIGATATKHMRNSLAVAAVIFFVGYFTLTPSLGNHGLWLSFILFLISRGIYQSVMARQILH